MSKACSNCSRIKANLECGLCHSILCKSCTQFVDEEAFSYLLKIPKDLTHQAYCFSCFEQKVRPEKEAYDQDLEKAKEISVFNKAQHKLTRHVKRIEPALQVRNCADEKEATMRLAFLAVKLNFNALLDIELEYEKVRSGSYQKLIWHGSAIPANLR